MMTSWRCRRGGWPMPETLLALQRTLAGLILAPEEAAFTLDPAGYAAAFGLPGPDQEAFLKFQERLLTYRELARMGLTEPIEDLLPVTKALLEAAGAWDEGLNAFVAAGCVASPHYRDIAPAFLGWLVETGWGQARWPYLTELAHFELLEVLVSRFPESQAPAGLTRRPLAASRIVLDPATQVVAYGHAVHRATEGEPEPLPEPTYLLAYRDPEGTYQLMELSDATAALLARAQAAPVGEVVRDLGLPDLDAVLALLATLRDQGALLGFTPSAR